MADHFTHVVIARTPFLYRLKLHFDGLVEDTHTILNAELMGSPRPIYPVNAEQPATDQAMAEGPLKQLWDIGGLTQDQARNRLLSSWNVRNYIPSYPLPAFGFDVNVDLAGRPNLIITFPIKDIEIIARLSLEFRHSIDK